MLGREARATMSVESALKRFRRTQLPDVKSKRKKKPCPWRPTPLEMAVGGDCRKCGYPAHTHPMGSQQ